MKNPESKIKAADYFARKLLKSPAGTHIKGLILFGSIAQGKADKDSDIDLLVFTDKRKRTLSAAWEAGVDTFKRFQESVEPLIYSPKELKKPRSYFLYHSIKTGRQLYP